jgi:Heme/copper-type cytochrome/quinol oxidases, subunit 1
MAIRTELLSPSYHVLSPTAYIQVVGEHGTMMMMMMTSVVVGPFGNYLVPLMIGSKRVAFPRIEALSFWLTPCAYVILLSSFLRRRVPDRLDRLRAAVRSRPARAWTRTRSRSA